MSLRYPLRSLICNEEPDMNVNDIIKKILYMLKQCNDVWVFKNIDLSLTLISVNDERMNDVGKQIEEFILELGGFSKRVMLVLADQSGSFENMEDIFRFFSFIDTEYGNEKGKLFVVNENIISKYKEYHLVKKEIQDALEEDRVEVFLQPIYSTHEQYFNSAEALVRIRKKSGELMSPGIFIPIAENSGQILELGERVFEKVCEFLQKMDATDCGLHYIEVNLSVVQCSCGHGS